MTDPTLIRNFCIIAHIDHGKSTLADRLLDTTGVVTSRERRDQVLDDMDLERERGITIKASAVRLPYTAQDGRRYILNLIDTPGHVDFSFEVAKSLKASEGAVLLVDASQGVEAQTVANWHLATEYHLVVIPVINKIDMTNAQPERVEQEIQQLLQDPDIEILRVSAKTGDGVVAVLERVVSDVAPPQGDAQAPLAALIVDSSYDPYKGVIVYVRVMHGTLARAMKIRFMGTGHLYEVQEVGVFMPRATPVDALSVGEVGYITCNIRTPKDVVAGDTVTDAQRPTAQPLPGFRPVKPNVFAGIYPTNPSEIGKLKDAIERLSLNDASFTSETEHSEALGPGLRCGFLGLLHMEIVQERLEREFGVSLVTTSPSVAYQVVLQGGKTMEIDSPAELPPLHQVQEVREPITMTFLLVPASAMGPVMQLATDRRGVYKSTDYLSAERVKLVFEIPLAELIVDFYDKLKSLTRGYGSMDYELTGFQAAKLVKLDIMINGQICEPLSSIVPKEKAYARGRQLAERLREIIPRQLFEVAVQAAIGGQVIARETVHALAKNVTGKCYGGDITRKRKLWDKQKEGKKRLKQFGQVEIPQEAFLAILKTD